MDEELNENELEAQLYAMLHHVDETQANVKAVGESEAVNIIENAPRSTIRRYWRKSGDHNPPPSLHQKINTPKETPTANKTVNTNVTIPKGEKHPSPPPTADLTIFQSTPRIVHKTIEILDNESPKPVVLESSDEDEVIEVALPPKPTITIESSDEDDICIVTKPTPPKNQDKEASKTNGDRDTASPVPSIVSSVSDDFIRGDCIALNISSRHADNHTFDFSLHGSDLLDQTTPTKKKKKKKSKELSTSTPMATTNSNDTDACFATPRSKAKHKKQKSKPVVEKTAPSMDVYDSDSNQSIITTAKQNSYIVTDKSLPSADVYDSDSNQSEIKVPSKGISKDADSSDSSISVENILQESSPETIKSMSNRNQNIMDDSVVDLTDNDYIMLDRSDITENIVMANVTGFAESMDYGDGSIEIPTPKLGSTKIPPMLYDNLDFDNLKGKDKVCKRRRYSLTTLRAEMEKFYNESWGGEEFNHMEIQKYMSRDKSLWAIDPKDRMPALTKRRTTCHYCNRPGHRDDMCRLKPRVCYMCGSAGHYEPRCPAKICVNCGSPNHMYSSMCRNCSSWHRITCAECGQGGHPASHCPDLWRRYHNTIDINMPLEESRQYKKHNQLYCSGCTRRGHLVHTCRLTLPFSAFPINSPYVSVYRPLYLPVNNSDGLENTNNREERNNQINSRNQSQDSSFSSQKSYSKDRNKRQSKSPNAFENQLKKKKHSSISESSESYINSENRGMENGKPRKLSTSAVGDDSTSRIVDADSAPDFIPISSTNRDKRGQIIQDNEVSDTSDAVTFARIYVTQDVLDKIKTEEGQEWLKNAMDKYNVCVEHSDVSSFLTAKGKFADQEAFQTELRDWMSPTSNSNRNTNNEVETDENYQSLDNSAMLSHIPKQRKNVLKVISKALDSLNYDLGEPNVLYKRLMQLQKQHKLLLKQKVISPDKLSNSSDNIKQVLKKLNMILLGQAGLGNGQQSLNKLYAMQRRLIELTQKTLSQGLRKEIAQHYQSIFVANERNDYSELLQKYHGINEKPNFYNIKKRNKKLKLEKKKDDNDGMNTSISPGSCNPAIQTMKENFAESDTNTPAKRVPKDTLARLVLFQRRIQQAHAKNRNYKIQRVNLVRKLHSFIQLLIRKEQITSKTAKKIRRVQSDARQFLETNV